MTASTIYAFGEKLATDRDATTGTHTLGMTMTPLASTPNRIRSTASTNALVLKATPCSLMDYAFYNANAAARFVRFFDKASTPNPAVDVPIWILQLDPVTDGVEHFPQGLRFLNGCSIAITGAGGLFDATAIAADDVIGNLSII
jgi:hypothetical protein